MQNKFTHILKNDLDLWNSSVDDSVTWAPSAATAPTLDRVTGKPLELTTCKNAQRFLRLVPALTLIYRSCADGTKGYDAYPNDGQQPFRAGRHFATFPPRAHIIRDRCSGHDGDTRDPQCDAYVSMMTDKST